MDHLHTVFAPPAAFRGLGMPIESSIVTAVGDLAETALLRRMAAIVGEAHVLVDPDVTKSYESDWTGRYSGRARFVIRPGSTEEVAQVLTECSSAGAAVVAQGGNTGLVGGGVPRGGEVVLSTSRLDSLSQVDPVSAQVTAGAGVSLARLQTYVRTQDLDVTVDLGSRDSATIGGMAATNAGGLRVVRYGTFRAAVVGLEAVLADGSTIARLSGLPKENVGYDLPSLLVGSEGTLAIITRVQLGLVPRLVARATTLVALPTTQSAVDLCIRVRRVLPSLEAAELFYANGLELVCAHRQLSPPFPATYPVYVLLECAGDIDPSDDLINAITQCADVADTIVGTDTLTRASLWLYREGHSDALAAAHSQLKLDIAVPPASLSDFVEDLHRLTHQIVPHPEVYLFGHICEGNIHINISRIQEDSPLAEAILRLVAQYRGSISAEHGVGQAKVPWVSLSRSDPDIKAMWAIKAALDPSGILNPGVLLPVAPASPKQKASGR